MRESKWDILELIVKRSESASSATTLASDWVGGDRSDVFDSSDFESITSKGTESGLSSWAWGFGVGASLSFKFDVDRVNSNDLESFDDLNRGKHG